MFDIYITLSLNARLISIQILKGRKITEHVIGSRTKLVQSWLDVMSAKYNKTLTDEHTRTRLANTDNFNIDFIFKIFSYLNQRLHKKA